MPFERSLEIERRLDDVLRLIRTGRYSTPKLAEEVGVSIPTISDRHSPAGKGHDIRAKRHDGGWRYILARPPQEAPKEIITRPPYQRSAKVHRMTAMAPVNLHFEDSGKWYSLPEWAEYFINVGKQLASADQSEKQNRHRDCRTNASVRGGICQPRDGNQRCGRARSLF